MRNSSTASQQRSQLSPKRGLNLSNSLTFGTPSKCGFASTYKSKSSNNFSTAAHSIKCSNHGHQQKLIQWVCLAKDCDLESRIACSKCVAGSHSIHQKYMIKIQEIFDHVDDMQITNWPLEEKGKNIKDYMNKENDYLSNIYKDLESFFEDFQEQILNRIATLKKNLLLDINNFYLRGEGKDKMTFLNTLKKIYAEAFDFSDLQEAIKKFFQREITYDTFNTSILQILNDKEAANEQKKLYAYYEKCVKNPSVANSSLVSAQIDRKNLSALQKQIMESISRLKTCVSVAQQQVIPEEELPKSLAIIMRQGVDSQEWGRQYEDILNFMNLQTQSLQERDCLVFKREVYADSSRFLGFLLNGQRSLLGTRYYSDGNIYFGQWARGMKQGNGIMQFRQGTFYQGEWNADKKHGYAIETYPNTSKYEGQFEDGMKHGMGKFTDQNKKIFEGLYLNDKRNGVGKFIFNDNSSEQVYYVMGEKVTEEKYEAYLQQGGYSAMSYMKNLIQETNQCQESSQANNTYMFNGQN